MTTVIKILLILLSTLLIQHNAFSYGKNSGKVSVSVSVSKTDKSGDKSAEVKGASESITIKVNTASNKDKSISKTVEIPFAKNLSNENSYSDDNRDKFFDGSYGKNKMGNKLNGKKFENAKQKRLSDSIKNFKNEENINAVNFKKLDDLVNKRIKEIAKTIKFKFDEDDEKQIFKFTKNASINIDKIKKKLS